MTVPWWVVAALLLLGVAAAVALWMALKTAASALWLVRAVVGAVALQVAVAAVLIQLGELQLGPQALIQLEQAWRWGLNHSWPFA